MPVQSLSFGKDTQNEWKSKRNNDSSQNNVIKILFFATYLRVSLMYKGIDVI